MSTAEADKGGTARSDKVFGVGLSKTGTKTLGTCLERLGFDHFSWRESFAERVLQGDVREAMRVARRHDSFDDLPWPALVEQLDAEFPSAKFILTVRRSADAWYESMLRHAEYKGATTVRERFYGHAVPHGRREELIEQYRRHNARVQARFADRPYKLLTICWEDDPGWEPLCDFLDLPVPDEPIPHRNKRRMLDATTLMRRVGYTVSGAVSRML